MPTPAWNRYGRRPVHLGAQSSRPARGEGNVTDGVVGWPATLANLAAASPVRQSRSLAGARYPSASVESAAPPSVEELRQVVPVSDMRGRLGAGPARCRMAGGYWLPTEAAGSSMSRCEPSNAVLPASRPDKRKARLTTCASYQPIASKAGLRPIRTIALDWFRAALHRSPARRCHTASATVRDSFNFICAICQAAAYLLTCASFSRCGLSGNAAAEDEGVLL